MSKRRYAVASWLMILVTAVLVAACGGGGGSTTSAGASSTVPATPASVTALCGNMKVTVSWAPVTGATSYNVYRSITSGVAGTLLGTSTTTSYVDTTGALGTTYYYTVAAVNSAGASVASLEASDAFYTLKGGALQTVPGASIALTGNVTTFAGSSGFSGLTDGTGTAAQFSLPNGVTTDGNYFYVADYLNNVIRKIDPVTRAVSVFAGSPAGTSGSADGVGTAALFFRPYDITSDGSSLFVTDYNNCTIRKVDIASATVSTFAGTAGTCSGTGATFAYPQGITTDGTSLFVTENTRVRRIDIATGAVSTFAGTGSVGHVDAVGTLASFNNLEGITTDGTSLFVTDRYYQDVRKIDIATAAVSSLAGNYTGTTTTSTDGTGIGATFNVPMGITTDGTNLYVTESSSGVTGGGYVVRKIANGTTAAAGTGVVTTLAGTPGVGGTTDGSATTALFRSLWGITVYCGNLIIVDNGNSSIRVLY